MTVSEEKRYPSNVVPGTNTLVYIPNRAHPTLVASGFYKGSAGEIIGQLKAEGLAIPTPNQTTEFLVRGYRSGLDEAIYFGDVFSQARHIMTRSHFKVFTGHVYDKEREKLFLSEIGFDGRWVQLPSADSLAERARKGDPGVKSLPLSSLVGGELSPLEVARSPYLEVLYGQDGAEMLAHMTEITKSGKAKLSFPSRDSSQIEGCMGCLGEEHGYLHIVGEYPGDNTGFTFGVVPSKV